MLLDWWGAISAAPAILVRGRNRDWKRRKDMRLGATVQIVSTAPRSSKDKDRILPQNLAGALPWEPVRNAGAQALPRPPESGCVSLQEAQGSH